MSDGSYKRRGERKEEGGCEAYRARAIAIVRAWAMSGAQRSDVLLNLPAYLLFYFRVRNFRSISFEMDGIGAGGKLGTRLIRSRSGR